MQHQHTLVQKHLRGVIRHSSVLITTPLKDLFKDLFDNVEAQKITDFITETRFISNFNVFVLMSVIYFFKRLTLL